MQYIEYWIKSDYFNLLCYFKPSIPIYFKIYRLKILLQGYSTATRRFIPGFKMVAITFKMVKYPARMRISTIVESIASELEYNQSTCKTFFF